MIPFERYKPPMHAPFPTPPWLPYPPVAPGPPIPWLPPVAPGPPVVAPVGIYPPVHPGPPVALPMGPRLGPRLVPHGIQGMGATTPASLWTQLNTWVSNTLVVDYGLAQGITIVALAAIALFAFKAMKK